MEGKRKISLVTYILSLLVMAIIVIAAIVVVFNKKENNENSKEMTTSQIDWEEYPKDIDEKVNEWIGGIDLSSEVGKVSYNLMKKTIYSLSQEKEDAFNKIYFNGDSTEIIEKNCNYSRYCYPDNENNDLSAKYN